MSLARWFTGSRSRPHRPWCEVGGREKLAEQYGLAVSTETVRQWMTDEGLWVPRSRRRNRVYPPRTRRASIGELVQIDGCDHAWFEGRGPKCTLLVYVDDATSRLMELRFIASESTFDYFASTRSYLERYGKPVAFYSDRARFFRPVARESRTSRRARSSHVAGSAGQGAAAAGDLPTRGFP